MESVRIALATALERDSVDVCRLRLLAQRNWREFGRHPLSAMVADGA
jgi:hypothetical protein